jgi:hypothetical protein
MIGRAVLGWSVGKKSMEMLNAGAGDGERRGWMRSFESDVFSGMGGTEWPLFQLDRWGFFKNGTISKREKRLDDYSHL